MNVVLWIIAGLLALAFLGAGLTKLVQPKEKLAATMGWVDDFSPGTVKLIGGLEVLAAIGLVLPAALDVVPVLVPLAAVGLVALMVGAAITHARRGEQRHDPREAQPGRALVRVQPARLVPAGARSRRRHPARVLRHLTLQPCLPTVSLDASTNGVEPEIGATR